MTNLFSASPLMNFWISLIRKNLELLRKTIIITITIIYNCLFMWIRISSQLWNHLKFWNKLDSEAHERIQPPLSILHFLFCGHGDGLTFFIDWLNNKWILWSCIHKNTFTLAKQSFCYFIIGWPLSWFALDCASISIEYSSSINPSIVLVKLGRLLLCLYIRAPCKI